MNANHDPEAVDQRAFRDALGSFVTGVTIVTTRGPAGNDIGLTANSFNSVSLDPPMVLWSLALSSSNLPAFRTAQWWAVHILSSEQETLSARFAQRSEQKFAGLAVARGPGDIPLLEGCAARFICRQAYEYEGGDHAIFVGQVLEFDRAGRPPLIYHEGRYGRVIAEAQEQGAAGAESFAGRFLGHQLGRAYVALFGDVRREYLRRDLTPGDFIVLTSVGLGDDRPLPDVLLQARRDGADRALDAVRDAAARGLVILQGDFVRLAEYGRTLLVELTAVAQASQMRVEDRLTASEIAMLRHLLDRVADQAGAGDRSAPSTAAAPRN
jgi:3-hydroxy-9,10-secoandrosta-1,3,5(10)-triene-9,17-dione monooxygenase reductase component